MNSSRFQSHQCCKAFNFASNVYILFEVCINLEFLIKVKAINEAAVKTTWHLVNKINVFKFSFIMFQIVFQNAEDIARESDRKRSFKSYQRNSWSSDLRKNARSDITSRPLSTGALLVCYFFFYLHAL